MTRIDQITVQGFRSFGPEPQPLDLGTPLAVVWGPNSEGKTSLAEAFEFLLTGDIARRELLASARDEFANALRNAHLSDDVPTFVEARIGARDGVTHTLRRTLIQDFSKRELCESTLELDGVPVAPEALHDLGIDLHEPPISAPVLMQHTLGYLFSAQPKERTLYFKSLLEVTDLDDLRDDLKEVMDALVPPQSEHLDRLVRCASLSPVTLAAIAQGAPTISEIETAISTVVTGLLTNAGEVAPPNLIDCLARLDSVVADRRAKTFPLHGLRRSAESVEWEPQPSSVWGDIDDYVLKLAEVDEETQRITALFQQLLALPVVDEADGPIDCPVCETPAGLTPERITAIRERVAGTSELQVAEAKAKTALQALDTSVRTLVSTVGNACPAFLGWNAVRRKEEGFRTNRIAPLLDDAERPLLPAWFNATVHLLRAKRSLERLAASAQARVAALQSNPSKLSADADLKTTFKALPQALAEVNVALDTYIEAIAPILTPLQASVDRKSDTTGWADLAELGRSTVELRGAVIARGKHDALVAEMKRACRQVDDAKEVVLEEKFEELAEDVRTWWDLLRPGEAAFFSDLGLRKGAQRTMDFKAGLSPSLDRSNVKIRDAVAVFSQSQLHCLGLATFFARAAAGDGFVILDDPIISIDDDYSAHFINSALAELAARDVQVIMLTYEQKTWRAIQARYGEGQAEAFQLNLDEPAKGTLLVKSSDRLAMMLKAAKPFTQSSVLSVRKDGCQRIRDCGERFCKELLVTKRREQGDSAALVTDYSDRRGSLDSLIDETVPYLDGSDEPGKLRMLGPLVNPGNHDDDVPSKTMLAVCLGNLKKLRQKYLA